MKSIVRLKVTILVSICLVCSLPFCLTDPFFSSKANITAVKLFPVNFSNISKSNNSRRTESIFGPMAKISRVVPIKRITKVEQQTDTISNFKKSSRLAAKSVVDTRSENVPISQSKLNFKRKFNVSKQDKPTPSSIPPPRAEKLVDNNPLILSSDSWNYLTSVITDEDLRQIISSLTDEVVTNISKISKTDPMEGQNMLLKNIFGELENLKRPRMLSVEDENFPVNKGVRFSAKQRKPILNVKPLEKHAVKKFATNLDNNILTPKTERWNISGAVSNGEIEMRPITQVPLYAFNDQVDVVGEKTYKQHNSSKAETITDTPVNNSTTPSLLQVLAVPELLTIDPPTFAPFLPSRGFVPVKSMISGAPYFNKTLIKLEDEGKIMSSDNKSTREESLNAPKSLSTANTFILRKPRGPPKEDEYLLPPITSTSTSSPEEPPKGYQTISESTTQGPTVIWYNHEQTPEDTFYPNFDNFLVPPEESSIEILPDLLAIQPTHNSDSKTTSDDVTFKLNNENNIKGHRSNKRRPNLHHRNSKEGINKNKNTDKSSSLQQAASATSDHDGVRDYYEYLDGKNDGSSKGNVYHEEKRHGTASHNNYNDILKYHEIIPRQQTNRKPVPYSADDTESYGALNVVDHFYDSYPPPVRSTTQEINPHRDINEEQHTYGTNNGPTTDSNFEREPKYRLKESSPGLGPYHGHHDYDEYHGHGWKDPSKDFFTKAKDYFKNSDFSTSEKWFEVSIGVLAFLAFGGYIIMLLYQVFTVSSRTSIGTLLGRSMEGAGEIFDLFFSKGPIGQAYLDELETIVKRAMANVKRIWLTNGFKEKAKPKIKGEVNFN